MGIARQEKMKLARAEAAERLRALATHVEQGIVLLGNETFKIPEEVRLEIKAERDELEVELKWKPSVMEELSDEDEKKKMRPEERTPPR